MNMTLKWLFASFCFVQSLGIATAENFYVAYIPQYIRPGFNITFTLSILNNSMNHVNVEAKLYSSDMDFLLRSNSNITSNKIARITLGSVPLEYHGSKRFTLNFTGTDSLTGFQLFHNSTSGFTYATKALSILIQTDKAIYQPGQTVKFRAVCLKPDLRPLVGNITYQIQDPKENIVLLESFVPLIHGVAGGELPLNKDAIPGDWKITFFAMGYKEILPITVKLYKLPKFKVEVKAPAYIYPKSEGFTITLKGTYTYGKPVKGKGKVTVMLAQGYHNYQYRYSQYSRPAKSIFGSTLPQPNTLSKSFQEFNGSKRIFITKQEVLSDLGWDELSDRSILITGYVTETLTMTTFNDTIEVAAKRTNIKVETIYKPDTIKPGLNYTAYIKVSEQDGKPLMEQYRINNKLKVKLTYRYPRGYTFFDDVTTPSSWYSPSRFEEIFFDIPVDGIVAFTLQAKNDEFTSVSFEAYTPETQHYNYKQSWRATRADSPSNSFLQITTADNTVSPGTVAQVNVETTEAINSLTILIISRGKIFQQISYVTPSSQLLNSHVITFPVKHEMIPSVQVLASYTRSDGEIVADYVQLSVSIALENQVSINSSATKVDAGDSVSIRVQTASPGSYVGARAIDQSVLLLKSGNDVSQDRIAKDLNRYSVSDQYSNENYFWCWYPMPSGAMDARQVFEKAGLIILTDALLFQSENNDYVKVFRQSEIAVRTSFQGNAILHKTSVTVSTASANTLPTLSVRSHFPETWLWKSALTGPALADVVPGSVDTVKGIKVTKQESAVIVTLRTYFPETWLWVEGISGSDGSAIFNTTAPDTITSWVLSAFSVSDEYGLGVADTAKITVFRKFFISLNLPLRITRGEIIIIQAIVFNYFKTDVNVRLTLDLTNKFELLVFGEDLEAAGPIRTFQIPADGAVSIKFPVRINDLGDVPITVSAISELAGDALTRNVYVRPEGIQECYSISSLINHASDNHALSQDNLEIKIPAGIVEGSAVVKLFIYGDVLGSTMNNLGRLLRIPGGCGEQNMLKFAPNVFITLYLYRTGSLDEETRIKAYRHFRDGYMIELKYKHNDGSYSAFGENDSHGSTWLTAFVVKCFLFARELRPELVEKRIIDQALEFLVNQQNKNGSFNERGRVSHRDMQGRVSSLLTMTAYVLIAIRETPYPIKNEKTRQASERAREYLEKTLPSILTDKYALALVTYALHLTNSSRANEALAALETLSTSSEGQTHWHEDTSGASSYSERWRPPYYRPPSNDVEMTAYALLTYVIRNDLSSAVPVLKWLTSKRNNLGGYSSTQDTVIAIQAMAKVAELLGNRSEDLTINVDHSHVPSFKDSYSIDETNFIVYHSVQIPSAEGVLIISAEGTGIAVAQLSVCYNIPTAPFVEEPFDCTVDVDSPDLNSALVKFCCRQKPDEKDPTGMFLFEVGLPNGFTIDVADGEAANPTAQLVELGDESVNIYFDKLEPKHELCTNLKLLRYADVAASKPASLSASDYYKPDKRVSRQYSSDVLSGAGACAICGSECVGCLDVGGTAARNFPKHTLWLTVLIPLLLALLLGD